MPLKLNDIKHPSSTNLLNKWADEKEAVIQQLQKQVQQLLNKK